jgi:replicative DNA helicase
MNSAAHLGDGILELIEQLKESPDIGVPLYGPLINTVTRGARLGKFYLRSAATGVGKSRSMMADACYLSCEKMWDPEIKDWSQLSAKQSALFISTELELSELQTMALAFISGVDENHIVTSRYDFGELDRVIEAAHIIKDAPLHTEFLPNFSLKDIENTIKKNIRENDSMYIFLDYIHTSMKILEEITRRSGGIKLREDNILFMISVKLKDICSQYGVFIMSATQLNMDYQHSKTPDQNLLRGAKSIADKTDVGSIYLDVTEQDLESLASILGKNGFESPTVKCSIYKNRGNGYKGIYLWMRADKSTCRFETIFATGWNYELTHINETKIIVEG